MQWLFIGIISKRRVSGDACIPVVELTKTQVIAS